MQCQVIVPQIVDLDDEDIRPFKSIGIILRRFTIDKKITNE